MINLPAHSIHRATGRGIFPPEMAAHTEKEKEEQRIAGQKLIADLQNLSGKESVNYKIAPGYYRFKDGYLCLSNLKNARITGEYGKVHLISETNQNVVRAQNCQDTVLSGITLDYDRMPFVQGTIRQYDAAGNLLVISIDDAYRQLFETWHTTFPSRIWFFDGKANENMRKAATIYGFLSGLTPVGDNLYSVSLDDALGKPFLPHFHLNLAVGDKVVLPYRAGDSGMNVHGCSRCLFEDIDLYAAYGFAICEYNGEGQNTYRRVKMIRRPGTDRLVVSAADGFHSIGVRHGATLEDCEFSYCFDDLFNAHNFLGSVLSVEEDGSFVLSFPGAVSLAKESEVSIFDFVTLESRGRVGFTRFEELTDPAWKERATGCREKMMAYYGAQNFRSFSSPSVYRVRFDRPVDARLLDGVSAYDYAEEGLVIRRCYLHDSLVRGILIRANHAKIYENVIAYCTWSAVLVETCFYWLEGPVVDTVSIRDNLIIEPNMGAEGLLYFAGIFVSPRMWDGAKNPDTKAVFRDVTVENNTFRGLNGGAFYARNTDGVIFRGNRIEGATKDLPANMLSILPIVHDSLIEIQCCDRIQVSDNTAADWETPYCKNLLDVGDKTDLTVI